MPKTIPVVPGSVKETITQERYIDPGEAARSDAAGMDVFEYMEGTDEAYWLTNSMIFYLYRDGANGSYLAKFVKPITREYIRDEADVVSGGVTIGKGFGGGPYHFILKRGKERIKEGRFQLEGIPRKYDGSMPLAPMGGSPELTQVLQLLRFTLDEIKNGRAGAGASMSSDMALAQKTAMEMVVNTQKVSNDLLAAQIAQLNARGSGGDVPEWGKQILTALIPVGVGLIAKILEPKDALSSLDQIAKAVTTLRSISGEVSTGAEPDMLTTLVQNGPALFQGAANLLGEARKASEVKMLAERTNAAAQPPPPPRGPAAPGAAIPMPAAAGFQVRPLVEGEDRAEWAFSEINRMCHEGHSGKLAYDFMLKIDADSVKALRDANLSYDDLLKLIESGSLHPRMADLAKEPNYRDFARQFYMALMAGAPPPELPPQ